MPAASRTMNFTLTVRDFNANGGGVHCSAASVVVDATTGPFVVSSQNTATAWIANGTNTATITWNVAGTTGGGVNAATVDILFSDDGGATFPYTLVSATPNDGTHSLTIPNYPTNSGRIKIQGSGNIFFDINNADIAISTTCSAAKVGISPAGTVTAEEGNAALDLNLSPTYGTPTSSFPGSLETSDPASTLAVDNNGSGCINFTGNLTVYDAYSFQVDQADTYTFSISSSGSMLVNIYQSPYASGSPCSNWLASSGVFNGTSVNLNGSVSLALVPGIEYTLLASSFSASTPPLPNPYTINVSSAGSGIVYDGVPNPGASFSYTYVNVDDATGNIVTIDPGADLSNAATFPDGFYTVHGLSYESSTNLAPYIGGPFSDLQDDLVILVFCGNLSANTVSVTITNPPMPVEFLSFEATATESDQVQLSWLTASERNNDFFEVERKEEWGEFVAIGSLTGAGTSESVKSYGFLDPAPSGDRLWYRLKQVDFDGQSSYSDIAEVRLSGNRTTYLMFPNPATEQVQIIPPLALQGIHHQVKLYDLQGKLLIEEEISASESRLDLQIEHLAPAMYLVRIASEQGKAVVMKLSIGS